MRWLKQVKLKSKHVCFFILNSTFLHLPGLSKMGGYLNLNLVDLFPKGKNRKEKKMCLFHCLSFPLQLLPGMYYSKPFVTFHQINAFEDQGCVVIDLCCQDNGISLEVYQLQNLRKAGEGLDQVNMSDLSGIVKIILNFPSSGFGFGTSYFSCLFGK